MFLNEEYWRYVDAQGIGLLIEISVEPWRRVVIYEAE
jgi:hypothetical protein